MDSSSKCPFFIFMYSVVLVTPPVFFLWGVELCSLIKLLIIICLYYVNVTL